MSLLHSSLVILTIGRIHTAPFAGQLGRRPNVQHVSRGNVGQIPRQTRLQRRIHNSVQR